MEKTHPPNESAPPYPGPPLNYSGPGAGAPPPPGYPGPQAGYPPGPQAGYPPGPQPGYPPGPQQPGYPPGPQQPGYPPGPQQPGYQAGGGPPVLQTTVTHVVVTPPLSDVPGQTVCPHCQQTVVTRIQHEDGLMTWAVCGGLAVFGCFFCCCIPFCIDSCKDVKHICPNCNNAIYLYKRL